MRSQPFVAFTFALAACSTPPPGGHDDTTSGTTSGTTTVTSVAPPDPATLPLACESGFTDIASVGDTAQPLWGRVLPGLVGSRFRLDVDGAGQVLAANEFLGTADFGAGVTLEQPAGGVFGHYLARFSPAGDLLWAKETSPYQTQRLAAGEGGSSWTEGLALGGGSSLLRRWDPAGAVVWERGFNLHAFTPTALRGDRLLAAFDLEGEPLDYGTGTLAPDEGSSTDAAVAVLDAAGQVVWARAFGASLWPGAASKEHASFVPFAAATPDGGVLVVVESERGAGATPATLRDLAVVRLDDAGEILWTRRFPRQKPGTDLRFVVGPAGEALLQLSVTTGEETDFGCGTFPGEGTALVKLDPDGRSAWTRTFPGYTDLLKASFDLQGNILLTGLSVPPCDLGGGEFIPPIAEASHGRLVVTELGPDGSHHHSGVVGGYLPPLDGNPFFPFVDPSGALIVGGNQGDLDTGLGVGPYPGTRVFLAKIQP